jgi:hypothetical protein
MADSEDVPYVTMTCMTTKKKFEAQPEVVVLSNGRYAYRCECPWKGKNDKTLTAFKFCSVTNYEAQERRKPSVVVVDDDDQKANTLEQIASTPESDIEEP